MNLKSALKFISLASMLTAVAASRSQAIAKIDSQEVLGERFADFLARVTAERDSTARARIAEAFVRKIVASGHPVIEGSTVHFLFNGKARRVSVPGDLNGWNPAADTMKRIAGTNLFYLPVSIDEAARFEYKLVVDSTWMLDPLNQQQAIGGYGVNSEVWMPRYSPPKDIEYRPDIRHGKLDTLSLKSKLLRRTHPVFVYTPPGYRKSGRPYPCVYVTDGGEYITLALMINVMDNLIAENRIEPVVGIFVDPRTDVRDAQTSKRMLDYSLSDTFVTSLITELRPMLMKKYKLTTRPEQTAIMGASLGGLISTYAAHQHPGVFGLSAAQSPAYWWKDSVIFRVIESTPKKPVKFYIDTGTIRDTQPQAMKMKNLLESRGYEVKYGEYPEGHNWVNWRARIDDILVYFWGKK